MKEGGGRKNIPQHPAGMRPEVQSLRLFQRKNKYREEGKKEGKKERRGKEGEKAFFIGKNPSLLQSVPGASHLTFVVE